MDAWAQLPAMSLSVIGGGGVTGGILAITTYSVKWFTVTVMVSPDTVPPRSTHWFAESSQ